MKYLGFWEKFQAAEQAAEVFEIKTIGFQLYPMIRTRLYYQLAQELGLFNNPHPNQEPKEAAEANPGLLSGLAQSKVVVVPFVRKIQGVDVYSQPIQEALDGECLCLEVADPEADMDLERIRAYGREKYDRVVYELMLKEKVRDVRDRWAKMAEVFEAEFGIGLGKFAEFPNWLVRRYISECMGFRDYFDAVGAKKLYIVNAYSSPAVVVGAKQAGVKVIEIQHGFISEYHPAYSYPNIRIQSAPTRLMVWGGYWAKAANFPKGLKAIVTGPSTQFLQQRELVASQPKKPKTILFTSQGALGAQLFSEAIAWAKSLPDYRLTYRLHPNESLADYPTKDLPENLTISHKTPGFLELLGQHEYLVGGFSTTLYEGLAFGLKVIVLPLPGFENVQRAIDLGDMTLATGGNSSAELTELLTEANLAQNPYSYYAKDFNLKRALRA